MQEPGRTHRPSPHPSRTRLEQLDQFHIDSQSEDDGDAWSRIGIDSETNERQATIRDEASRRRAVRNGSRPSGGWQSHPSRSWRYNDTAGDGAGSEYQNGGGQAIPYGRRFPYIPRRSPEIPLYANERHRFIPRGAPEPQSYANETYINIRPSTERLAPGIRRRPPESPSSSDPYSRHLPPRPRYSSSYDVDTNPYARPISQFLPAYDSDDGFQARPQPQPPLPPLMDLPSPNELQMEREVAKLRKDMNRMERQKAKDREEIEKLEKEKRKQKEAAELREEQRKYEEKLKRDIQRHINTELEKNYVAKRDVQGIETRLEAPRRRLENEPREFLDYLLPLMAERQIERSWRTREETRGPEMSRLLMDLVQFLGHRYQDEEMMHATPPRNSWDESGRGRLERGPSQPYQSRIGDALRHQIENVVLEMLDRREELEMADYPLERPMFPPTERSQGSRQRLMPQVRPVVSERNRVNEGQRRSNIRWQDGRNSGKVSEPTSPNGSLGLQSSSSHTAINNYDQTPPSEPSQTDSRSPRSTTSGRQGELARGLDGHIDGFTGLSARNSNHEGRSFPLNTQVEWSGDGRGRPEAVRDIPSEQWRSNNNATRRRPVNSTRHDAVQGIHPSDESEDEDPRPLRVPREYTYRPTRRSMSDTMPPPAVPDPPPAPRRMQPPVTPGNGQSRRSVAQEDVQDDEWGQ